MRPKNKLQRQVAEMSSKLPAITIEQEKWAKQNSVSHMGFKMKKQILCTECGKYFSHTEKIKDGKHIICPHCGQKLDIQNSKKRTDLEIEYFCFVTTRKGFQVMRYFYIEKICKVGKAAHYFIQEEMQRWLQPDLNFITVARGRLMNSAYMQDMWCKPSNLEVREYDHSAYHVPVYSVYPRKRMLPCWSKYGIKKNFYGTNPFDFIREVCHTPVAETLLKSGQYNLLADAVNGYDYHISKYWDSIKICIRNKYKVNDASMWFDYLDFLEHYHKDLHNAHYVCPQNLGVAHDEYVEKKKRDDERAEKERNAKKILEEKKYEQEYEKLKSKFFGIEISDGKIKIQVLKSIDEFKNESEAMHHCVFSCGYYKRPDSLILSARIGDERIETVEVSLKKFNVVQSRAVCNGQSEYHNHIIDLVKKNMNLIKKAAA